MKSLRILFVGRGLPVDGSGGANAYRLSLLRYLASVGCTIEVVVLDYASMIEEPVSTLFDNPLVGLRRVVAPSYSQLPQWSGPVTIHESIQVRRIVEEFRPDCLIVNYAWLAPLFDMIPRSQQVLKAVLTHDVQFQRIQRFAAQGLQPYKRDTQPAARVWGVDLEKRLLSKSDVICAIQQEDLFTFRQLLSEATVLYMPMAAEIKPYRTVAPVSGRCIFVGGGAAHNVHGISWFLGEVWPTIRPSIPHASLHICGDVGLNLVSWGDSVTICGRVSNLDVEYAQAEVCVVPILVGSGLKIKLVEALQYGVACVSTSVGVEGIEEVAQAGVTVADSSEEFVQAVRQLLWNGSRRRLHEEMNRIFALTRLGPETAYGTFLRTVEQWSIRTAPATDVA